MVGPPANAFDTSIGGWQVNLDTTLSSGVDIRTSETDPRFIGIQNGGSFTGANGDNGTLNYRSGTPVAAVQRITSELEIKRGDSGLFLRATGFYDPINDSYRTDFQPLSRAAVRDIGADLRLLDGYGYARPSILGHPFDIRVGAQVLNWGESTFIPFGINSIEPLDVTALRSPGTELRQAFLPIPTFDVKTEIAPGLSFEAFWQFVWTRYRLEPDGSFFSTNDTVFDGGTYANLRTDLPDSRRSIYTVGLASGNLFGAAYPRSLDRHPTGLDEFGAALRWTSSYLDGAELGLYFENYHSRTPFGSYRTGRQNVSGLPGSLAPLPFPATTLLTGGIARQTYDGTASFFADYPRDIHLLGLSFNAAGPGGVALQGEVSHRFNQPIQLATADLALAVTVPALRVTSPLSPGVQSTYRQALADPVIQAAGIPGFNQVIDGWKRYGVTQLQGTATKLFGANPGLWINSIAVVGEMGFDFVHDFPRDRGLFSSYYSTDTNSATTAAATVLGSGRLSNKGLASQFSGAYIVATIVDMPDLLPYAIGMRPTVSLRHDFVGTSPIGVNVFQENTAAVSVGVTFSYLQAVTLGVQYTNHFPIFAGGKFYGSIDRDFVSAVLSYEF